MLISCPECKNQISDKGVICPTCAYPFTLFELLEKVISRKDPNINPTSNNALDDKNFTSCTEINGDKVIYTVKEIKELLDIGITQAYDLVNI